MANRDLLREAIADAKAVKEVAIANAKAALEEAFTPQLQSMLSEKIAQLDEEDELSEADKVNKEKQMEEAKEVETEGKEKTNEAEELEEELDLEEILAELELEEGDHEMEEGLDEAEDEAEAEEEGEDDAELDLENMSEEELQSFIEDVIEDMIEDGELVPGPNADESEAEEEEDTDDGMEGDADVDVEVDDIDLEEGKVMDALKAKLEKGGEKFAEKALKVLQSMEIEGAAPGMNKEGKELKEDELEEGKVMDALKSKLEKGGEKFAEKALKVLQSMEIEGAAPGMNKEGKELKEAKLVIKHLQNELNEVNLLNSKLLYTNKIFKAKNLTENQKIKVLKAFDKAETVNEAKVIFESLSENLVNKSTKSNIKESMGFASKPAGVAPKRPITEQKVIEEDAMVSRFKKLAGLK